MIQFHEMKLPYELFPLPNSKPWRRTAPGICLEGTYTNEVCVAYQQEVIIPTGFKKFGVRKLGFSYCRRCRHGIKKLVAYQALIQCKKDWSQTDNYSIFEDNIHHETVTWLQLIIQAKLHPPFAKSNN